MIDKQLPSGARLLPLLVLFVAIAVWSALWMLQVFPESVFPSPLAVAKGLGEEVRTGRLLGDLVASLFRVTTGFMLAVVLGLPVGLWLGRHVRSRFALLPAINFFRSLSPRSEEHTSELQSLAYLVCRLLLEKKKKKKIKTSYVNQKKHKELTKT